MSKPPFVVPEGVTFNVEDDGVTIANAGDVVLHTTFGKPLKSVVSHEGSVIIHGDASGGTVQAAADVEIHGGATLAGVTGGGKVTIAGNVQSGTIRGDSVHLSGGTIQARGIQGARSVTIGDAKVTVDAILAPEVNVSSGTGGRVTVIESHNELGANALKGCFRLADYAEMFGDPAAFLRDRGLNALGDSPPPAPTPAAAAPAPAPKPKPAKAAPVAEEPPVIIEKTPDPEPIEVIDETPPSPAGPEHPMHQQLADTVVKIVECYNGGELPPAVERLRVMVDGRQYDQIRSEITNIWSELLKFHQKKGMRIQHTVTTTFNSVNSLIKKM